MMDFVSKVGGQQHSSVGKTLGKSALFDHYQRLAN
jgi:hypothetical protein